MYHYEALGDERFQELCQALIVKQFPHAQCLPVGQPDGGRDAFLLTQMMRMPQGRTENDSTVFQVKFSKSPTGNKSEREFIESIIKLEKSKIEKLKLRGLKRYYLLTNVQGTSHLDSGSIDRVNEILRSELGIDAYCWWRDDIDRRIDALPNLKWAYPEILKATDLLGHLLEGRLGEAEERRRAAIKAYLTCQYHDEQELKFKQTDLRSSMTDLFVDLPMRLGSGSGREGKNIQSNSQFMLADVSMQGENLKAASYLLCKSSNGDDRIVIEGAPGQGKSTITQYVCQVFRMKFLGIKEELAKLPSHFHHTYVRIPFRIDLRDFAKWISASEQNLDKNVMPSDVEARSLEGFLAGQVKSVSGGHDFSVSDLQAVSRAGPIFLALDGFDEVADVSLRKKLVEEISRGVNRLASAGGQPMRTIVTSRPAAFAKSVRFPPEQWMYFELLPLERQQVDEYTDRWCVAKGLSVGDTAALKAIIDAKIGDAHTSLLSRNPMQLTILLSLINVRGASLPDKRTAMYDAYMDLFFNRESEKSDIVREYRDVLIDIHRYIAWLLQCEAESGSNGSVERTKLRTILFMYLDSQGENISIVDKLFNGIVERVGALVSRLQETYEFEVQPLREYFAARHLHETAPYPQGDACVDDKLIRFRALLTNPYWLNVARFYAGCFSRGEMLTLANELIENAATEPYRLTSRPRNVALMLLGDWVFAQYQPAVKQVVKFLCEEPHFSCVLATSLTESLYWASLPERSGRSEFLDELWLKLRYCKYYDRIYCLCIGIMANSKPEEIFRRWNELKDFLDFNIWIETGSLFDIFNADNYRELVRMGISNNRNVIRHVVMNQGCEFIDSEEFRNSAIPVIKNSVVPHFRHTDYKNMSGVELVALILAPFQYEYGLSKSSQPLYVVVDSEFGRDVGSIFSFELNCPNYFNDEQRAAVAVYREFMGTPIPLLRVSIEPWRVLVDALRAAWGDCPAIDRIAFIAAGIKNPNELGVPSEIRCTADLVGSARYARLKSGAPAWWKSRLEGEHVSEELVRLLKLLFLWGTARTIFHLRHAIFNATLRVENIMWERMTWELQRAFHMRAESDFDLSDDQIEDILSLGPRVSLLFGLRLGRSSKLKIALGLKDLNSDDHAAEIDFALSAFSAIDENFEDWPILIEKIKVFYAGSRRGAFYTVSPSINPPRDVIERVSRNPQDYPLALVAAVDRALLVEAGASVPKLIDVANKGGWFRGLGYETLH